MVVLLIVASAGAYFPYVKSGQPWLIGRETFIYKDNLVNYVCHISENYFVYTIRQKNDSMKPDTYSIHSVDFSTGETFTIQENNLVTISSNDVFKISGDYFVWALGKYSYTGDLYGINLKTKVKKKIEGIARDLNHISLCGSLVVTKSKDSSATAPSIYYFDIDKDSVAKEIVKLNANSTYFYNGNMVITFENSIFTIYDPISNEKKEISVFDTISDMPKRLVNYCNGYLLYESDNGFACCYNFNKNVNILLYKLCDDERLWTEYNQNSRLITLTRAFNKQTSNPAYISHTQYMVFDTKTEKLYEVTPLFEKSEYCLARNNSSYENKLVFLHYVKNEESEKTNCVIECIEFPDSKDEEPRKYYVIDSKKRPCSLRSYPMICNGKIAYVEESLREEDYKEKIVIFSYEQNSEKGQECSLIFGRDFDGYTSLEGSIANYSVVTQYPVDCNKIGRCGEKPWTFQFNASSNDYDMMFDVESKIKNHPLKCQQTVGSKIILLNKDGLFYYKYTENDDYPLYIGISNISAYATSNDYCCFYSNNSTLYLSFSENPSKLEKLFDFPCFDVEKLYIKGDNIFLQTYKIISEPPFQKKYLIVYNIPKKEKFIVESKEHAILDGALRGDSLYFIVNTGSAGYNYNRHRLAKQRIGGDYQETLMQAYGHQMLTIHDNPYSDMLCVQKDLTIADGSNTPVYESNIYIINPANDSMVETFRSDQINNFSLLSYYNNTIAMLYEDEESFQAKLVSAEPAGKITEQRIPMINHDSGFINIQLTDKYVNLTRNDFVKRDSDYMLFRYR